MTQYLRNSLWLLIPLLFLFLFTGCTATTPLSGWSGVVASGDNLILGSMSGEVVTLGREGEVIDRTALVEGATGGLGCASSGPLVYIYGTPACDGDMVYVAASDGKLYVTNLANQLSKSIYLDESNPQPIFSSPVIWGQNIYITSSDGKIYCLDKGSLEEVWHYEAKDKIWATPVIYGESLFVGSLDRNIYALDLRSGDLIWSFEGGGSFVTSGVIADDTLYVGSMDRHFYAIDINTGELRWKSKETAGRWFWTDAVVLDDAVYAPCLDNKVYAFDCDGGDLKTTIVLDGRVASSPVLIQDKIVLVTEDGKLYSIDESQQPKKLLELNYTIRAPLNYYNEVLYIHTQTEERVLAIDVDSGTILWSTPLR